MTIGILLGFVWCLAAPAQIRIIDEPPFDQITLDAESRNAVLRVKPLGFPNGEPPEKPLPNTKLIVRLVDDPTDDYEVFWRNIVDIKTYPHLVLAEANRLVREGGRDSSKLDQAFEYFDFLRKKYPRLTNLNASVNQFLYTDGRRLFTEKKYAQALGVLEELYRRDRSFRQGERTIFQMLGAAADNLLKQYIEDQEKDLEKYAVGRQLLIRLEKQYGPPLSPVTSKWRGALELLAKAKQTEARRLLEAGQFRAASLVSRDMEQILPDVEGARELLAAVEREYPMFSVGVMQAAQNNGQPRSLADWASRRVGRLTHDTMFQFDGFGAEGGKYVFKYGEAEISEDSRRLTLKIQRSGQDRRRVTGYDVSRRLLQLANPADPQYQPSWARVLASAKVEEVYRVHLDLRIPYVLPQALLQTPLHALERTARGEMVANGPYRIAEKKEQLVLLAANPQWPQNDGPRRAEIEEIHYTGAAEAIADLEEGKIDVVDRLFPGDAARLKQNPGKLRVAPYGAPSIHVLVPKYSDLFVGNRNFRRGVLFAIDRNRLLQQELLADQTLPGCKVVSGPFPAGVSGDETLAYAYDESIAPREFNPWLAITLIGVAQGELAKKAEQQGTKPPVLGPLVIGHPPTEAAQIACRGIVDMLKVIRVQAKLKPLPPGEVLDPEDECHFTYVEIVMTEPLIDAPRLFGLNGLAPLNSAYLRQMLRRIDESTTWRAARDQLRKLHRIAAFELPVIPLWQIVDHFAYRRDLAGFGENPVWLYQNLSGWRNIRVAQQR